MDALLFLDDDGLLPRTDTAELCRQAFADDPKLGIVSFRIADPETGVTQRRHVPRLRASDPMRSSRVTTFLGGANAVRTQVLAEVGGAARRVLLRPRGDRPRLAGPRRGLD